MSLLITKILKRSDAKDQLAYLQNALNEEEQLRKEFYNWIKPEVKAEFINGEIVIHSPVRRRHWKANDLLYSLLSFYVRFKQLGETGTEKVMITLSRNDYEPDIVFFDKKKVANFKDDQVLFPPPDFIVELLSPKTAKHDRTIKLVDYAYHGIPEYWIVDPVKKRVEQYLLPTNKKPTCLPKY